MSFRGSFKLFVVYFVFLYKTANKSREFVTDTNRDGSKKRIPIHGNALFIQTIRTMPKDLDC